MRAKPGEFIGAGLSQQVLKKQGTLRLTARDIFYTQKFRCRRQYGDIDFEIQQMNETQLVSIGYSYHFSKGKKDCAGKKNSRQRK